MTTQHHQHQKLQEAVDAATTIKEQPGVSLDQVKGYLHLDDAPLNMSDEDLWLLVLECWRSMKGTLKQPDVPPRLLLQVIAIRYYHLSPDPDPTLQYLGVKRKVRTV